MTTEKITSGKELLLSQYVEDFVDQSDGGWFDVKDIYRHCEIKDRQGRNTISHKLRRLKDDAKIRPHDSRSGVYRKVMLDLPLVNWLEADVSNTIDLLWPFGLERYVALYPRSVVVLAGSFNAGKTAFLFNVIKLNMADKDLVYFNSEMGPEEMKSRITKFGLDLSEWNFRAYERSGNFADVIFPDAINLIDYLEVTTDFYLVAEEITAIWNKLHKGMAIIAVQKKRGQELGRGAEFSAEKPRLYLTMDGGKPAGKLKIVKAKNWIDPTVNPNGLEWSFRLHGGAEFEVIEEPEDTEVDE